MVKTSVRDCVLKTGRDMNSHSARAQNRNRTPQTVTKFSSNRIQPPDDTSSLFPHEDGLWRNENPNMQKSEQKKTKE